MRPISKQVAAPLLTWMIVLVSVSIGSAVVSMTCFALNDKKEGSKRAKYSTPTTASACKGSSGAGSLLQRAACFWSTHLPCSMEEQPWKNLNSCMKPDFGDTHLSQNHFARTELNSRHSFSAHKSLNPSV